METTTNATLRLGINEAARSLGISRAHLYKQIRAGNIRVQKDGARTLITAVELHRYVDRLSAEQPVLSAPESEPNADTTRDPATVTLEWRRKPHGRGRLGHPSKGA